MTDQPARTRLADVIHELGPKRDGSHGSAGRLVERWLPGGTRGVAGVRAIAARHRFAIMVAAVAVLVGVLVAVVVSVGQPAAESPPALPPAVHAGPAAPTTSAAPTTLVISVVGRVARPGLVTLPVGSRVADALLAAGGPLPGTNDLALNLARRLTDGEQLYVGIPVPPQAAAAEPSAPSRGPAAKVDLNTATDDQLQTLPGVGPAMSQHILDWRQQHGHFDSISQLQDVDGIGDGRYAKLKDLVTT